MDSARYVDNELEDLLNADGGARFELDRFLCPPPELAENWLGDGTPGLLHQRGTASDRASATSSWITTPRAVINDTLPRSTARDEQAQGFRASDQPRRDPSVDSAGRDTDVECDAGENLAGDDISRGSGGGCGGGNKSIRPLGPSRHAEAASLTIDGEAVTGDVEEGAVQRSVSGDEGPRVYGRLGIEASENGSGNGLVRAWGLKDPRVARAMMKRMKRMRKFQTGEVRGAGWAIVTVAADSSMSLVHRS